MNEQTILELIFTHGNDGQKQHAVDHLLLMLGAESKQEREKEQKKQRGRALAEALKGPPLGPNFTLRAFMEKHLKASVPTRLITSFANHLYHYTHIKGSKNGSAGANRYTAASEHGLLRALTVWRSRKNGEITQHLKFHKEVNA